MAFTCFCSYTYICIHTNTCAYTQIHVHTHIDTCAYTQIHVHAHRYMCIHTDTCAKKERERENKQIKMRKELGPKPFSC